MLNLCTGGTRKRMNLATSRFYSPEELFNFVMHSYSGSALTLEYGPNLYELIENEHELRFACKLLAHDHASYISDDDYEEHLRCIADSNHTDKYEKQQADSAKCRRTHRLAKTTDRCCSAPPRVNSVTETKLPSGPEKPCDSSSSE
jgi:hypothetical protein